MADKSRTFPIKYYNEELLNPIFDHIRENKDKYFVAFRDGRITIYYKKRVLVTLKPESKDIWIIYHRDLFKPKKTSPLKKDLEALNKRIKDKSIDFGRGNHWILELEKSINGKYTDLIEFTKGIIDEYLKVRFNGKETEETIQCDLACKYQDVKNGLLCIDTEFEQPDRNKIDIKGRYDFIFLKKDSSSDKYKLIFVELKSTKKACKDNSGLVSHYDDMKDYLIKFKGDKTINGIMKEGVKFAVKTKKALGIITDDIDEEKDIDFENPEFWFLFKMADEKHRITTKEQILKLISKDIKSKSEDEINDILNNSYYDDFIKITN